jgi:hypothetical protein
VAAIGKPASGAEAGTPGIVRNHSLDDRLPRRQGVQEGLVVQRHGTLRSTGDTLCDLDICYMKASKGEHQRCEDNPE